LVALVRFRLGLLVAKTTQIAHKVLEIGFLLQGALSVGPVWHTATNIFGSAHMEAWRTQDNLAHPKVALTPAAQQHWTSRLQDIVGNLCLSEQDGSLIVDTLNPFYIRGTEVHGRMEQVFRSYRLTIQAQLGSFEAGSSPRQKWGMDGCFPCASNSTTSSASLICSAVAKGARGSTSGLNRSRP
jgi:hypothetical protein